MAGKFAMITGALAFAMAAAGPVSGQTAAPSAPQVAVKNPQHFEAFPPFRLAGPLYYVGSRSLGSFVVKTSKGLILINTGYEPNTPLIEASLEKLGLHLKDVKILLISHAHIDHDAGAAGIIAKTGAKYYVMQEDVDVVESGGRKDYHYGERPDEYYTPVHVDRVLHHLDKVTLGGVTLTAHKTAGHTKGATTWTMETREGGKVRHVVILGGPTLNRGMRFANNPKYPTLIQDYRDGFAYLRKLPVDVWAGPHDWYFDLAPKYAKFAAGDRNAFVDPKGYMAFIDRNEKLFNDAVAKEAAEDAAKSAASPR